MDQWPPDEVDAHAQFMRDFAARLETGEFVDTQALAHDGAFVRYDGRRVLTGGGGKPSPGCARQSAVVVADDGHLSWNVDAGGP